VLPEENAEVERKNRRRKGNWIITGRNDVSVMFVLHLDFGMKWESLFDYPTTNTIDPAHTATVR
jgi:hypothetical protein